MSYISPERRLDSPSVLPVNDTVVFYSPMQGDQDSGTTLVRTGTLGEGSCFYHSVLHACSKEYASASISKRLDLVKKLRSNLAGTMNRVEWEDLSGGLIARLPFEENINNILSGVYSWVVNGSRTNSKSVDKIVKTDNSDFIEIITELIPLEDGFEKVILPKGYAASEGASLNACKRAIRKEIVCYLGTRPDIGKLSDNKLSNLKKIVLNFADKIFEEAEKIAYTEYVNGLQDVSEDVDQQTIGLLSDKFERDIYFIDAGTRMPYQNASSNANLKGRRSVIVLWINEAHYEIVGRLVDSEYGRTVQREFSHNDPLIRKFKMFLCDPGRIRDTHPDLAEYLPREYLPSDSDAYVSSPDSPNTADIETGYSE